MNSQPRVPNLPRYFTILVAALIAIGPLSIDTYLPAMPVMADIFGVSIEQVNFTIIMYTIGYGLAQLVGGPLSDQIGRKKVGYIGLVIFIICSFLIANADSILEIQILRIGQAFGGAFSTVICMAMIRDAYEAEEAARRIPTVIVVMMVAPLLAPAIGTLLLRFGWASIFIFLALYGALLLFLFSRIPETAHDIPGKVNFPNFIHQYREVISRRIEGKLIPIRYVLAIGLSSGAMIVFVSNASFIYLIHYELSATMFPILFGVNIVMMMFFTTITGRLLKIITAHRIFRTGLILQLVFVILLVLAVLLIESLPLWIFTLLLSCAIGMIGLISPSGTGMFMGHFDRLAGSAASILAVSVFAIGGPLAAVSQFFYDDTLLPIVLIMLIGVILSNLLAMTIPTPTNTEAIKTD